MLFLTNQVALWRYSGFEDHAAYLDAWSKLVDMAAAAGVDELIYDLTGNSGGAGRSSTKQASEHLLAVSTFDLIYVHQWDGFQVLEFMLPWANCSITLFQLKKESHAILRTPEHSL